jgi:hypothetical protein
MSNHHNHIAKAFDSSLEEFTVVEKMLTQFGS